MKRQIQNIPRPSVAEKFALFCAASTALFLVICASAIVFGASYQPATGPFAAVLGDGFALLWVTAASLAHLVFVPAFCTTVALRDSRRQRSGIAIPEPRSVWVGHESVFGKDSERRAA